MGSNKSLKHRREKKKNRRVLKRRKIEEPHCTCDEEYIEPHECPLKAEIDGDYEECQCCEYCTQNCADDI